MKQFWGKKELILLEISPKAILVLQPKSNLLLFSPSVLNLKLSGDNLDTKIYLKEERLLWGTEQSSVNADGELRVWKGRI